MLERTSTTNVVSTDSHVSSKRQRIIEQYEKELDALAQEAKESKRNKRHYAIAARLVRQAEPKIGDRVIVEGICKGILLSMNKDKGIYMINADKRTFKKPHKKRRQVWARFGQVRKDME